MVKIEKKEFDFDYKNNLKLGIEYCYNDCTIIYFSMKYLLGFLNNFFNVFWNFSDLPLTIATLSKKIIKMFYPKVFYKVDKYFEHNIRSYYFGGKTEPFNFNTLYNGIYLDCNSLYPYCLSKYNFSYGKCFRFFIDKIDFSIKNSLAFEVDIIENQQYPLYPSRLENSFKVIFANGLKRVIITKPEYNFLIKHKILGKEIIIVKVISVFITNQKIKFNFLFESLYYIRKTYESEHPYNYFIKILLNSGYGKFGERIEKKSYEIISDTTNIDFENEYIYDFNDSFIREKDFIQEYLEINLINAILTTSYARFTLWKMIIKCNKLGIKVYYVDTDSIVIEKNGFELLKKYIDNKKLGKWKIELSFDIFQCIDSKEYISKYIEKDIEVFKAKFKGLPSKLLESYNDIIEHIENGTKINLIGTFFYCKERSEQSNSIFVITKHKNSFFMKRKLNLDLTSNPITIHSNFQNIEKNNKRILLKHLLNVKI